MDNPAIDHLPHELILIDNEYPDSLLRDINAAKISIDLETYIFSDDKVGKLISAALVKSARKGIKIRVLVDGIGTFNWKSTFYHEMEEAGITTKIYHPIIFAFNQWLPTSKFKNKIVYSLTHINSRNHRKTCIIDHEIAYIGSSNINEMTYINSRKVYWHDISVKLTGIDLTDLQYAFDKAWGCISFKNRAKNFFVKIQSDPIFRLNDTLRKRRSLYKELLNKIQQSTQRIDIINAYFIPKQFLLTALIQAHKRGVDIRILLPYDSDVLGMSLLSKLSYLPLLKVGINIKHHTDGILHTKIFIIDDWFCLGSSNLNYRSLKHDLEVDVKIQSRSSKERLENHFNEVYSDAKPIDKQGTTLSFYEKIILCFFWLIKSWY